jgi:hypothetical protein
MVRKLYENFLDDRKQYKACEGFWEQLVQNIAESLGQTGEWQRWIPRQYADGTPFELDGNPIFDGRSQKLNRAFRIIQHCAAGNELEIAAWLNSYEEEYTDLPRHELVINMSLSQESAQLAEVLLRKWMTPTTTTDDMQAFITKILHNLRSE